MFKNTVYFILASLIATFIANVQASFADDSSPAIISLSGTGSVNIAPDMAIISFGIVKEAKTAREALDENNKAVAEILQALAKENIENKDIQTSGFNIQPRYFYPKRKTNGEQDAPKITGYLVTNTLTIRIRNIQNAGSILDLSVSLGVNSGGNIKFTNADTSIALKKARRQAVKDALQKAQTLANAAGVRLGNILTISENSTRPRPIGIAQARTLNIQENASVPIAAGENTYRVTVQMSWEIAQ